MEERHDGDGDGTEEDAIKVSNDINWEIKEERNNMTRRNVINIIRQL